MPPILSGNEISRTHSFPPGPSRTRRVVQAEGPLRIIVAPSAIQHCGTAAPSRSPPPCTIQVWLGSGWPRKPGWPRPPVSPLLGGRSFTIGPFYANPELLIGFAAAVACTIALRFMLQATVAGNAAPRPNIFALEFWLGLVERAALAPNPRRGRGQAYRLNTEATVGCTEKSPAFGRG